MKKTGRIMGTRAAGGVQSIVRSITSIVFIV